MKADELRKMTVKDLQALLEELKDELANLRIQKATLQIQNPNRIREVKRDIARIKTILREYELGISKPIEETK